jgi:hypothetical protein
MECNGIWSMTRCYALLKLNNMKNKFKYNPKTAHDWWDSLSIDLKVEYKKRFSEYVKTKESNKYPNMYDLDNYRISQLGDKHIVRIWVFKDMI